jgi:hypothetical protein
MFILKMTSLHPTVDVLIDVPSLFRALAPRSNPIIRQEVAAGVHQTLALLMLCVSNTVRRRVILLQLHPLLEVQRTPRAIFLEAVMERGPAVIRKERRAKIEKGNTAPKTEIEASLLADLPHQAIETETVFMVHRPSPKPRAIVEEAKLQKCCRRVGLPIRPLVTLHLVRRRLSSPNPDPHQFMEVAEVTWTSQLLKILQVLRNLLSMNTAIVICGVPHPLLNRLPWMPFSIAQVLHMSTDLNPRTLKTIAPSIDPNHLSL